MQKLLIVESPAKAKTIGKYLGKEFIVLASYGHVRDLLAKSGSVDPKNDFFMHYEPVAKNKKYFDKIVQAAKKVQHVYLATDPDREGEAIAWHISQMLNEKFKELEFARVVFFEITKKAVQKAVAEPRDLSMPLVNSQQARRALDYLVGFNLSPLLWSKIKRGLSAGRVQSPALKMIVEREEEIAKFVPKEYWDITVNLGDKDDHINTKLTILHDTKLTKFSLNTEELATQAETDLKAVKPSIAVVSKLDSKEKKRNPAPPFTTSTLQQEAARKLGFSAKKTMMVAQQLYEGAGSDGLITYMRTDSVHLSEDAITDIREYIAKEYPKEQLPKTKRIFKSKSKNAQEAHEAIRPTSIARHPDSNLALEKDQLRLYKLIWQRTLASQMASGIIQLNSIDFNIGPHVVHATGNTIKFKGFMTLYLEGKDDEKQEIENALPPLSIGDKLPLFSIKKAQHFTEPAPRFSEATLVKNLEKHDIGRPSTYASIIATLQTRGYVTLEAKRFHPTDIGTVVNKFLNSCFETYVEYTFTANLEDKLDAIARGEISHLPVLNDFWDNFIEKINKVEKSVSRDDFTSEDIEKPCPKCKGKLHIKLGKNGRFICCKNYPECDYTEDLGNTNTKEPEVLEKPCPKCNSALHYKFGPYGKFIGCSSYPKCKYIEPLNKPKETNVDCPSCQEGKMSEKRTRRGKIFYACNRYPKCKYALWNEPVQATCPKCNFAILTVKETKKDGIRHICPNSPCDYTKSISS